VCRESSTSRRSVSPSHRGGGEQQDTDGKEEDKAEEEAGEEEEEEEEEEEDRRMILGGRFSREFKSVQQTVQKRKAVEIVRGWWCGRARRRQGTGSRFPFEELQAQQRPQLLYYSFHVCVFLIQ
jgi:hypothetical protein